MQIGVGDVFVLYFSGKLEVKLIFHDGLFNLAHLGNFLRVKIADKI
jgi:hypothetical protein